MRSVTNRMPPLAPAPRGSALARVSAWIDRAARVAFTFVVLNVSAVEALGAALLKKKVWR